jgi:cold shock CspA family protein
MIAEADGRWSEVFLGLTRAASHQRMLAVRRVSTTLTRRKASPDPSASWTKYPPADRAVVEESGTVKWYNAMKGFGFIVSDRGGRDIFVHASALDRAGIAGLTEGQRVAVDVIDGRKGPEAAGLRLI